MKSYIIEGGERLEGFVEISGSKNAALPIIAASILNIGTTKLYNIPNIHDTKVTLEILKYIGCEIKKNKDKIEINSEKIRLKEIPEKLMREMRSTVIIAGALLRKIQRSEVFLPRGMQYRSKTNRLTSQIL